MPTDTPERLLLQVRTIAVIGCSTQPGKAAHEVPRYLKEHGYRIIPVHPSAVEILGERAYPSLATIPQRIDLVNVFRPSEEAPALVESAIAANAPAVWLQQGIAHEAAAALARSAGLAIVMDTCIMQVHRQLALTRGVASNGRLRRTAPRSFVGRIAMLAVGWMFIVLGVAGLFLPILQGILFLAIGLLVLSKESVIAHRWLEALKQRYPKINKPLRRAAAWWRVRTSRFRRRS